MYNKQQFYFPLLQVEMPINTYDACVPSSLLFSRFAHFEKFKISPHSHDCVNLILLKMFTHKYLIFYYLLYLLFFYPYFHTFILLCLAACVWTVECSVPSLYTLLHADICVLFCVSLLVVRPTTATKNPQTFRICMWQFLCFLRGQQKCS